MQHLTFPTRLLNSHLCNNLPALSPRLTCCYIMRVSGPRETAHHHDVIFIGAGVSGLAAASHLTENIHILIGL